MSSGKTCKFIDEITCPRNTKKKIKNKKSEGQKETTPALVSFAIGRDGSEG